MKRAISVCCCAAVMLTLSPFSARAEEVSASARAYVLYCPQNEEIILSKNKDEQLPMASTTKVMTALITLEAAEKENRTVTFTSQMTAEGSSMYLERGERVTLDDLCVGMLMQSGNDAANAAALTVSESFEEFSDLMNKRAQEIGMKHTHFVTPSGLDDEEHYSTAYDMARLLSEAMKNKRFAEISKNTSMTVDFIDPEDKRVTYPNHNKLLKLYESCTGGKTGYTKKAGRCLVSSAFKDGVELVCVTLDDPDDWNDHIRLFDYGFSHLSALTFEDEAVEVPIAGEDEKIRLIPEEKTIVSSHPAGDFKRRLIVPDFVFLPVKKGERLGEIIYTADGEEPIRIALLSKRDIAAVQKKKTLFDYIKGLFQWH